MHQGKHIIKGIKGEESDELAGQTADFATDFTGIGDVRDLYAEWHNYSEGKDVDKLSAGLAAIGLAMSLGDLAGKVGGIFTGGATAAATTALFLPIKNTCVAIKKTLKFMNPKLKKACQSLFEPVFKQIGQTKLLSDMPNLRKLDEVTSYAKKNMNEIGDIAKLASTRFTQLGDLVTVYRKNPYAAKLIAEDATNIKNFSALSKMTLDLGNNGRDIFRFGGKNALNAMETLGNTGKLSADTLKSAMRVGSSGLKAVAKGCWHSLSKILNLIQKYKPLLWWFMLQYFFSKIPLWLALCLELLIITIIIKTWSPGWNGSQNQQVQA